ncbi:MAG: hypothetical protein RR478_02300, partial [Bacilli bacterium]
MKKSKITLVVAIFLGVIALLASSYVVYDVFFNKDEVNGSVKDKTEVLDLKSDLVEKLYKIVSADFSSETDKQYIINGDKPDDGRTSASLKDLSTEMKQKMAYKALTESEKVKKSCSTTTIANPYFVNSYNREILCGSEEDKNVLTETFSLDAYTKHYKEIFGKDVTVPTSEFSSLYGINMFVLDKTNDTFYDFYYVSGLMGIETYKLEKAEKTNNKIDIVVKRYVEDE